MEPSSSRLSKTGKERKIESDDKATERKTRIDDEKCASCGLRDEDKAIETDEGQKTVMSKKKSHKHNDDFNWIRCDVCQNWYHYSCSGLEQYQFYFIKKFHCSKCVDSSGPSVEYEKVASHRQKWYSKREREIEKVEVGSEKWIAELKKWEKDIPAPTEKDIFVVENGHEFDEKFREMGGLGNWKKIFLIRNKDGLGMRMPERDQFDVENIVDILGEGYKVDTIDVYNQKTYSMKLSTFLKKMRDPAPRKLLYNFLSLEFSDNEKMRNFVSPPSFVKNVSFVNKLWPDVGTCEHNLVSKRGDLLEEKQRPRVEEFCLAGMADSYTDFHIDFGGSSVYYHVFKGQKVFYVAEPSKKNLKAFQKFASRHETYEWFGDKIPGKVRRISINEGETLFIPAGWIHAVWTPKDSLVFGGNFLHLGNVEMQFRIYHLEKAVRGLVEIDDKFYFPNFEFVNWMFLRNVMLKRLRETNDEGCVMADTDEAMWRAVQCMVLELREWFDKKEGNNEDQKDKLLASFENQVKIQKKLYNKSNKSGKTTKRKTKRSSPSFDDDFEPSVNKRKK